MKTCAQAGNHLLTALKTPWWIRSLAMLRDKEAARLLNSLAIESRAIFRSSDSSAFTDFLQDYFCEDDPSNESPGKLKRLMCSHIPPIEGHTLPLSCR